MQRLMIFLMIATMLSPTLGYADRSVSLVKGNKAPYSGVLMDNERSNKVKKELIEKDYLDKANKSLEKSVSFERDNNQHLSTKVTTLTEQNTKLADQLGKERSFTSWERVLWFSLGIVATGAAVYGASKL